MVAKKIKEKGRVVKNAFTRGYNKKRLQIFICKRFASDLGRTRTCNPQSRNLIFYPIELRSQKERPIKKLERNPLYQAYCEVRCKCTILLLE